MNLRRLGVGPAVMLLCAVVSLTAPAASAQETPRNVALDLPALARYVSGDVRLFVEIDHLPQISARLRERHVWPLLLSLLGSDDAGWDGVLTETLGAVTGAESSPLFMRLFQERVALAAPNWQRLGEGVILFSQADPQAMRLLVDQQQRREARRVGRVRITQTKTGLWIALAGRVAVLSLRQGPGTLFDKSTDLLSGGAQDSLAVSEEFRARVAGLPSPRFACAYWRAGSAPQATTQPAAVLSPWYSALRSGALAVRLRRHQWKVSLRGLSSEGQGDRYRPRVQLSPVLSLPQTTLVVWQTSIDAEELLAPSRGAAPPERLLPLWDTLRANADRARFQEEVIANIGARCQVFLAADFSSSTFPPQLGFMIESVDAPAVVETLHDFAGQIIEAVNSNGEAEPAVILSSSTHRGIVLHEMHLTKSLEAPGVTFAALMADGMAPSFAAVNGWVALATSPAYLRQVIDASLGEAARLEPILRLKERGKQLRRSVSAAVLQPSLMVGALRYWNNMLRDNRRLAQGSVRLGVSVHTGPRPGQVMIADVHSNGPSVGALLPGDAVIACNDQLLSMERANEHLRELLVHTSPGQPVRLRLLRAGEIVETSVSSSVSDLPLGTAARLAEFLDRLAPLEPFVLELAAATYFVERPSGGVYRAQLVLDFERPPPVAPRGSSADQEPSSP